MSGAALETPNVGPRVTSIGELIDAAPRAGYPSDKAELIARLNSEGAKRHLGAAHGRSRAIYYVTDTLPLAVRDALRAVHAAWNKPVEIPLPVPQTAEQQGLSDRFVEVLARKPKAAARVARDLGVSLTDLHDMARDGRRITVEAALAVSREFKVDLQTLLIGEAAIDEEALHRAIYSEFFDILRYIQPPAGHVVLNLKGCQFEGEDARTYHQLAITSHLTTKISEHYRWYIALRDDQCNTRR